MYAAEYMLIIYGYVYLNGGEILIVENDIL